MGGLSHWYKVLDQALAILILGVGILGSTILLLKSLFRREPLQCTFSCGELVLLPESWRRWMLGEKKALW